MKNKNMKTKQISAEKGGSNNKRFPMDKDPFFNEKGSKRLRREEDEEDIESEEEEEDFGFDTFGSDEEDEKEKEEEDEEETAAERKKRLAMALLQKTREQAKREEEEEDGDDGDRVEREGLRDSLVAKILQQEQLEESGRVRRQIASRYTLLIPKKAE